MKRILQVILGLFLLVTTTQAQVMCRTPQSFGAVPLTGGTTAAIIWAGTGATKYELQYRVAGTDRYTSVIVTTNGGAIDSGYYRLSNLTACTAYGYRLRSICGAGDSSIWSSVRDFKTLGCPEPCRAPSGLFATANDTSASLNWTPSVGATGYQVMIKRSTDTASRTITVNTNSLAIRGLVACTNYQFKVKTLCANNQASDFSETRTFKTGGCSTPCMTPREVRATAAGTSVIVAWIGSLPANYELQYRVGNDSTWRSVNVSTLVYTLPNAGNCTAYSFRVRMLCSATVSSEWSSTVRAVSSGCINTSCDAPRSLSASGATNTGVTLKWDTVRGVTGRTYDLQYLTIGDTTWRTVSGLRGNTYNLTGLTTCKVYAFRVRTNCTATSSSIWSAPMRFETTGCPPPCKAPINLRLTVNDTVLVAIWSGTAANYVVTIVGVDSASFPRRTINVAGTTTTITGLARCKNYILTIQSVCDGRLSEASRYGFETRCATNCTPPLGLGSEIVSDTVALLKFLTVPTQAYVLQYRVAGTTAWTNAQIPINTAALPYRLTGLRKCTQYEWRITRICGNVGTAESRIESFKTRGCATCPEGRLVSIVRGDSVVIEIATTSSASRFILLVSLRGATRVDSIVSTTPRFVLRGLTLCQNYTAKAIIFCANGASTFTESISFRPGINCLWDGDIEGFLAAVNPSSAVNISPNPGHEAVQVTYTLAQDTDLSVQMMNLQGQVVSQLTLGAQEAGNYVQTLDGLGNLPNGMYLVVLRSNGKVLNTLKWQKQ
jgi:trimeric autotransporter adhesin